MGPTLSIDGLIFEPQRIIKDNRGAIMHMINKHHLSLNAFGEIYFSKIHPKTIKGWKQHFQLTQRLIVPMGSIKLTVHDTRAHSDTKGHTNTLVLGPEELYGLLILPPQLWYAFSNEGGSDALLCNCISEIHDPLESQTRPLNDPSMPLVRNLNDASDR